MPLQQIPSNATGAARILASASAVRQTRTWREVALFALVCYGLHLTTARFGYLLFHSLAEFFSIAIATSVFIIAVNCWERMRNQYLMFIGIAYLFVGVLDLLHALSFKGMGVFTDYDYYAPQFWIAARYLESFSMLGAFAFLGARRRLNRPLLVAAFTAVTAALILSILTFKVFPVCFVAGHGLTRFKVNSEYVICGVLALSLLQLVRQRQHFDERVFRLVAWSLVLMIASELCFTLYVSDAMNDAFNEAGHLLKVATFYALYKAVVATGLRAPMNLVFRELKQSEEKLLEAHALARLGTWEWEVASDRWSWSPEIYRLLDLSTAKVAPSLQALLAAIDAGEREMLLQQLGSTWRSRAPLDVLLTVGGTAVASRRSLQMRGRALVDQHGAVLRLSGTIQDVTEQRRAMQAAELAREKEKLEALIKTSGDGVHILDPQGHVIEVNDKFCRMLGYRREELLRMNVRQWDAPHSDEELKARLAEILGAGEAVFETRHRRRDGTTFDVEISASRISYGDRLAIWNSSRDITERKRIETRLKLAASVFTHASEGILITDPHGQIIEVNDSMTRITGFERHEMVGANPKIFKSGRQPTEFYRDMWHKLTDSGQWTGELWNRRKDGEVFAEALTINAVRNAAGEVEHYVGMLTDITEIKEQGRKLEHMAHYDALTGLPNRMLLADRLRQSMLHAQRRGNSLAVAFLDLDRFKVINDRHGHAAGDQVLVAVAQSMRAALREGDTLSRLGGDEFVAVINDLDRVDGCAPILARLLQCARSQVPSDGRLLQLSASIGVTVYPSDGSSEADGLLRHADQAMYLAKEAGGDRVHWFDVQQDAAVKTQRESVEHIRLALTRGEFVLHYQPKVNMRTREVVGAEALIRWQHPERGLLAPAVFLPIVENQSISVDIGKWVIEAAVAQIERWQAAGLDLPVSVNVGAAQLLSADFSDHLVSQLALHPHVRPEWLELEILETSALENTSRVSEIMAECRAIGVRFALDDFGTGYSSLSYLKHLPVEAVKIDQSFVRDILSDAGDLALVKGVIGLAEAFHKEVIAEGVETADHASMLLSLGCELGQGFGIARPMGAAQVPCWVAQWQEASLEADDEESVRVEDSA